MRGIETRLKKLEADRGGNGTLAIFTTIYEDRQGNAAHRSAFAVAEGHPAISSKDFTGAAAFEKAVNELCLRACGHGLSKSESLALKSLSE
jgi:hypothetical protein